MHLHENSEVKSTGSHCERARCFYINPQMYYLCMYTHNFHFMAYAAILPIKSKPLACVKLIVPSGQTQGFMRGTRPFHYSKN